MPASARLARPPLPSPCPQRCCDAKPASTESEFYRDREKDDRYYGASEREDRVLERSSGTRNMKWKSFDRDIFFDNFSRSPPSPPLRRSILASSFLAVWGGRTWMGEQSGYWEWRKISARNLETSQLFVANGGCEARFAILPVIPFVVLPNLLYCSSWQTCDGLKFK